MNITGIRIRSARSEDASTLTAVAHAAKRHWGYPEELIQLWRADLTVTPAFITSHPVYCAVKGSEIVGFYALSREGDTFELEHMWVHPKHMGEGVGASLFEHAINFIRSRGGRILKIASDPNAEGFYHQMGARRVGEIPSRPEGRTLPLLVVRVESYRATAKVIGLSF